MFGSVCSWWHKRAANSRLRWAVGFTVLAALVAAPVASASSTHGRVGAAAGNHPLHARIDHRAYGLVPSGLAGHRHHGRPTPSDFAGSPFDSTNNLNYNGGPVMQTNTTYAIYWAPSSYNGSPTFSGPYQTLINQFFTDVAAAKNASNDVYAVDTQYYSGSGSSPNYISNSSTFAGSAVATDPLPADQCSSEYTGSGVTPQGCVTNAQIQAEVSKVIAANGWTPNANTEFFLFTPRNLGSCFDTYSGQCAFTYYCAYHSNFTDSSGREVLYANQPYTETNSIGAAGACASGQYPNGDQAADSTINVVSHEHNETITDPLGNAWYDSSGNEIGDKCGWNFGTALGSTGSGQYNQVLNGHDYYLQQEWSNASTGCALKYGTSAGPPQAVSSVSLSPSTVSGGSSSTGTVNLAGAAPTGGESVTLGSDNSAAQVPGSVTVQAGASSAKFTVTTSAVSALTTANISATGGGATASAPLTINPVSSHTAAPTGTTITTGSLGGGSYQSLAADDGVFYQVRSSGRSTPTTDWYGVFSGIPTTLSNLKVTYDGSNSRSCSQTIYIYNWSTRSWATLNSSTVGTAEVLIGGLTPSGAASNYVSSSGQVDVRVRGRASGSFTANGDELQISYSA